jgi:hypothetical protein
VNAARLTSGSGSSSWRTPNSQLIEAKPHGTKLFGRTPADPQVGLADQVANWPTVCASEVRQGFQDRSRGMKCSQESLTTAVVKDAANWPTPNAQVSQDGESPETWLKRKEAMKAKGYNGNGCGTPLTIAVQLHGQAARASSSSLGSRQGLWATPRSGKTTDENPETWALRQAKGDVATMPLTAQVKCWGTPAANDANKQNVMCEVNSKQAGLPKSVGLELQRQWGTPTARDHKSGRGNNEREYKELTPMVERQQSGKLNQAWVCCLMGVPVGWVDPMCPASVIKNWPRFVSGWLRPQTAPIACDSSAMELCRLPQSEPSEFSLASLDEGQTPIVCRGEGGKRMPKDNL